MTWDATRRLYLDDNGNPVDPAQLREWIDQFISNAQTEIDDHSNQLLAGAITVAAFFAFLSSLLTSMHLASAMIAYGGADQMSNVRWGRVDEKISSEFAYLAAFQDQVKQAQATAEAMASKVADLAMVNPAIPSGLDDVVRERVAAAIAGNSVSDVTTVTREAVQSALADSIGTDEAAALGKEFAGAVVDTFGDRLDTLIFGAVESRSRKYADAAWSTFANSEKAREGDAGLAGVMRICEDDPASCDICPGLATADFVSFDEVTDIGEGTVCQCRCYFEFEYAGVGPLSIDRSVYASV